MNKFLLNSTMMTPKEKCEILKLVFPKECYMVEPDVLDTICSTRVELTRTEFGSNADLLEIFHVLVDASSFIDNAVSVVLALRKKGQAAQPVQQIKEEVVKSTKTRYVFRDDKIELLVIETIRRVTYD